MAEQKQTVYVFNDGSWQANFLIDELTEKDQKNVKVIDTGLKFEELADQKNIDFRKDYLSKMDPNLAKEKGLVVSLHFTSEDYAKRNNDSEDSQDLGTQLKFLKAEFPNILFLFGYRFHGREKLRKIFMLPDDQGNQRPGAKAMQERILNEKKQAKKQFNEKQEIAAAKEREATIEATKDKESLLTKVNEVKGETKLFNENTGVGDNGAQDMDNERPKKKPKNK
jgi:hypothetical protein